MPSGILVNLNKPGALQAYFEHGIYGTRIKKGVPSNVFLGTLADYMAIRPGDLVFFFLERQVYGTGRVVPFVPERPQDVVLCNYPKSYDPDRERRSGESYLWDEARQYPNLWTAEMLQELDIPWIITFEPHPHFYGVGLDMDEILEADRAGVASQLRIFEGVSFIKLNPREADFVLEMLLRKNEGRSDFRDNSAARSQTRAGICGLGQEALGQHTVDIDDFVFKYARPRKRTVEPEMALQTWLVHQLTRQEPGVAGILGSWEFVGNQFPASPLKPVKYMDRIDVFGYTQYWASPDVPAVVNRYKIVEIKSGVVGYAEREGNPVAQLMKYVDWVAHNISGGDYSMVDAYLIAKGFMPDVIRYTAENASRRYVIPRRPFATLEWNGLRLLQYDVTADRKVRLVP